eukprot:5167372-Pyramimonas_sp.AAC.1
MTRIIRCRLTERGLKDRHTDEVKTSTATSTCRGLRMANVLAAQHIGASFAARTYPRHCIRA